MTHRVLLVVYAAFVFAVVSVRADQIVVRGQEAPVDGTIKSEDAKEVVISVPVPMKKAEIRKYPSADVLDMFLKDEISPVTLTTGTGAYKLAVDAEKAADTDDAVVRKAKLDIAIAQYAKTLKEMVKNSTYQKNAARHVQYKVAVLMARQASDQLGLDQAVVKLQEFKTDHANSWQIHSVMPLIAQIQMESKDYAKAAATFEEMAAMKVLPTEVRRDAELKVVEVAVRAKDMKLAYERLDALEKKAADTPALLARVKLARADVLVGEKQFDKAAPILHELVKNSTDKQIKALAHNALGEGLFKAGKYQEAMWEFLWVDAVFNQDRTQHAKSLYFLWKTFEQLNNMERAIECRDQLINERIFNGTEWQREALKSK